MGDKELNSEKKQAIPPQSHLSDDLIIQEILTRLPIKSVLRFKSVSKKWYSSLSSSYFANSHFINSPLSHSSAPVNTLFIVGHKNCYVFSYDDDQISGTFEDNLIKLDPECGVEISDLELAGSCNGLICLIPESSQYIILWNPAIRKLNKYASHGYFDKVRYVATGFGYASSIDDYKYVEIPTVNQGTPRKDIACIFSLRENRWRKIDFSNDFVLFRNGVLVGEKLYWTAYSEQEESLLVSFDLGIEKFDVIKIGRDRFDLLGVMGGCLSKCNYSETSIGEGLLHIMEPPVIVKSTIALPKGLNLDMVSQLIGFTKTDKFFVTGSFSDEEGDFLSRRKLVIVDTCTKPMQCTTVLRFHELIEIARYVPSLVSPFPSEEPLPSEA